MIWLIGNKGMLGAEVERRLKDQNIHYVATDNEVDITDLSVIKDFTAPLSLECIINCAAYTAVDKAEDDQEKCYCINREGVRSIAKTASMKSARLLHVSTDYVFDGTSQTPYNETDSRNPIGVYGKSKAAGEETIEELIDMHYIIRTAWLYGLNGNNFVSTMLKLFRERDEVNVVNDQFGTPTYAPDLAEVIVSVAVSGSSNYGIYHYTNEGTASWHEFAVEIHRQAKENGMPMVVSRINAITTERYPTRARRPMYSVLSKEKIKNVFGIKIRDWKAALKEYIACL